MPLSISRLRITSGGRSVFDERFTPGVNVIEGENSSGKSTLLKLLYFGLGGSLNSRQWTRAALRCDRVYTEVLIGPAVLTLSRRVSETGLPPVLVYDGNIDEAIQRPIEDWREYSYSRSADKQSYSQLMFSMLRMPDAFSQTGDFLTFNQFLRVHYADQDSPNSSLLRFEDQFDKPSTREAIGNFILGGTDQNLAKVEQQLRENLNRYSESLASVTSANILLGSDYNELSAAGLYANEQRINVEMAELQERVQAISRLGLRPILASDINQDRLSDLARRLGDLKSELADRLSSRAELELDFKDSRLFLNTLNQRLDYLTQTLQIADDLGDIRLDACPACGSPVEPHIDHSHCYLCKSDVGREKPTARYFSMLNATQMQIEQSSSIQSTRQQHLMKLGSEISSLRLEIEQCAQALQVEKVTVSTVEQAELGSIQNRLGYLEGELDRVRRDKRVVERLDALRGDRDRLSAEIAQAREDIERIRNGAALRVGGAMVKVSREAAEFLEADLDRQVEFHDDPHVEIDFRGNTFGINGEKSFSASSMAYLRNAILLGVLFAADQIATMRHLHLLILENLEDKGMEPERYHRLHRTILERAAALSAPFQIIIGTADLAPDVRQNVNLIGRRYTHQDKTLMLPADDAAQNEG